MTLQKTARRSRLVFFLIFGILFQSLNTSSVSAQTLNPDPPQEPVKLIFIHHSVGEAWLTDGDGDLGRVLGLNNYFASDTNYGWGPDSIGDNTDYYNWYDWFVGPESPRYLSALYNQSDKNSDYSRSLADPGGENQIIIFKSCFPNSDLTGRRDAPAANEELFSLGHAKFVYNQLLEYFITRPDKLFIAITPPPVLDPANALNAREFSRWLVEDWLAEKDYPLNNVVVWDLHNLLTHPNNHHRYIDGKIEHTYTYGPGTLYYDSLGDEHPNYLGNQKATEEFIPMLNIFYNQWVATAPAGPLSIEGVEQPDAPETDELKEQDGGEVAILKPAEAASEPESQNGDERSLNNGLIDNFEGESPASTSGWEFFWDESNAANHLSCGIDSSLAAEGSSSLRIDFHVEPGGWASCTLFYDSIPDFGEAIGLSFDYRANTTDLDLDVNAHSGSQDNRSTFFYKVAAVPESIDTWVHVDLAWDQIVRVAWEDNPGTSVDPAEINGFAFGFNADSGKPNSGTIWIDNLALYQGKSINSDEIQEEKTNTADEPDASNGMDSVEPVDEPESTGKRSLCPGSMAMIGMVGLLGGVALKKQRNKNY